MMMIRPIAALALPLAVGLSAPVPAAKSDPLAGRVAGPPQRCIGRPGNQGPVIADEGLILYRTTGKRIWRATVIGPCPGIRPFNTLILEVYGSQLCRNDRFRTLPPQSIIPSAYCRFGEFIPYDKVETPDQQR